MPNSNIKSTLAQFKRWAIFCLLICIIIASAMTALHFSGTVQGVGTVKARHELSILAPYSGQLSYVNPTPHSMIKKGTIIATIHSRELEEQRASLSDKVNEMKARLQVQKSKLAVTKLAPLPENLQNVKFDIQLTQKQLDFHQQKCERSKALLQKGSISQNVFNNTQLEYEEALNQLEHQKRRNKLIESGLAENILHQQQSEIDLIVSQLKTLEHSLERLTALMERGVLKSPYDGFLMIQPLNLGDAIVENTPIAAIAPESSKLIRARIPQNEIQDVMPQQEVLCDSIHYDRYQTGSFAGKVLCIYTPAQQDHYLVDIELLEEPKAVQYGSSMKVTILTREQSLYAGIMHAFK